MTAKVFVLLVASTCFGTRSASAQRIAGPRFATGVVWAAQAPAPVALGMDQSGILGDGSKDHRYTGFWVGAGTGFGLGLLAAAFCEDEQRKSCDISPPAAILGALFSGAILGTVGALIGAQIERTPAAVATP